MFELDPISDTLLCFALGLGALGVGVLSLFFGRQRLRRAGWAFPLIVGLLLAAPAVGMAATGATYSSFLPLVLLASFFGILAAARTSLLQSMAHHFVDSFRRAWVAPACLAVLGLGLIGWQVFALDRQLAVEIDRTDIKLRANISSGIEPIPGWMVQTDKGRNVQMMRMIQDSEAGPTEADYIHSLGLDLNVIQTGPGDESYNCHGWVFGGGKAWISGVFVDSILEDNAYQTVSQPIAGDVVVFRDPEGKVSHTGLVRANTDDGCILLESKWGKMGRYIHTPEQHCFHSHQATYYHTRRVGHQLHSAKYEPKSVAQH